MLHFSGLKDIGHFLPHFSSRFRSFWRISQSVDDELGLYTTQSSAKRQTLDLRASGMSLMYMRNRRGPRNVPCGTPDITSTGLIDAPWTLTTCCLPTRKETIQSWREPLIPKCLSLWRSLWCGTVPKALAKSNITASTCFVFSLAFQMWWTVVSSWVSQERLALKPCWKSLRAWWPSRWLITWL